jgi:hypothetical protein
LFNGELVVDHWDIFKNNGRFGWIRLGWWWWGVIGNSFKNKVRLLMVVGGYWELFQEQSKIIDGGGGYWELFQKQSNIWWWLGVIGNSFKNKVRLDGGGWLLGTLSKTK